MPSRLRPKPLSRVPCARHGTKLVSGCVQILYVPWLVVPEIDMIISEIIYQADMGKEFFNFLTNRLEHISFFTISINILLIDKFITFTV